MAVWGLWHTSPGRRGLGPPCPAGRPRSFGGGGTHAPIRGGRGTRTPYEIRDPGQETPAHPEDPSECHSHAVGPVARDGCSNSEIGAELFLSPRTVEWHLRKVFTKLGISSRRELQGALPDRTGLARPA